MEEKSGDQERGGDKGKRRQKLVEKLKSVEKPVPKEDAAKKKSSGISIKDSCKPLVKPDGPPPPPPPPSNGAQSRRAPQLLPALESAKSIPDSNESKDATQEIPPGATTYRYRRSYRHGKKLYKEVPPTFAINVLPSSELKVNPKLSLAK